MAPETKDAPERLTSEELYPPEGETLIFDKSQGEYQDASTVERGYYDDRERGEKGKVRSTVAAEDHPESQKFSDTTEERKEYLEKLASGDTLLQVQAQQSLDNAEQVEQDQEEAKKAKAEADKAEAEAEVKRAQAKADAVAKRTSAKKEPAKTSSSSSSS